MTTEIMQITLSDKPAEARWAKKQYSAPMLRG